MLDELAPLFGVKVAPHKAWLAASNRYLAQIQECLNEMSGIALEARADGLSRVVIEGLDRDFQKLKKRISLIIDGNSGAKEPEAKIGDLPLFLGYVPEAGWPGINLYTRYGAGKLSVAFAEGVWGADNNRPLSEGFTPVTESERRYRRQHGIGKSNCFPQTSRELLVRRLGNIFDLHFGTLRTREGASRMYTQVRRSCAQISGIASKQAAFFSRLEEGAGQVQQWLSMIERGNRKNWIGAHRGLLRS